MGKTRAVFVLDESGSMFGVRNATISGFNEYLEDLQKEDSDEATLTLVKFSSRANVVYANQPIDDVDKLSESSYAPGGSTALYDAISFGVQAVEQSVKKDDKVIVVVMTDGHENSSKETTREHILSLIEGKEKLGNWTFVYLGANQDAWEVSQSFGIKKGNAATYFANAADTVGTFSGVAAATNNLRSSTAVQSASLLASDEYVATKRSRVDEEAKKTS